METYIAIEKNLPTISLDSDPEIDTDPYKTNADLKQ
jgi:hypothetical protein